MAVYRRNSNVKGIVVRSTLPPNRPPPRGSFACGTCKSCDHKNDKLRPKQSNPFSHTEQGATFTSSSTDEKYIIHKHLICQTENVVYLPTCTLCQYVGETCRTLKDRIVEHCADVRHKRNTPSGHSADNISAMCIDNPPKPDTTMRETKKIKKNLEKYWIIKLQTSQPSCSNIKD